MLYSLYVGHYSSSKIPKEVVKKLNDLGLVGYIFSRGDYYALKVYATANEKQAYYMKAFLESKGLVTEVEIQQIRK